MRNNDNVPHIFGATDGDVYFALGFAHAQDRLWQMTMLRRTVQGRLSEVFGARTVKIDELMRRYDLYGLAQQSVAVQDAAAGGEKPEPAEVVATAQKPTPAALQTADDVVVDMAMRIAALLRAPVAEGQGRIPEPLALASIEALRPGSLAELDNPSSVLSSRLSSEDRETLRNARDRVASDTSAATQAISQSINKVAPQATLTITRSALAKKVSGHGRYEPFPGETFMAGRPLRAIVYVELENFAARPARVGDPIQRGIPVTEQVSVDLAQSISLFHDATGLLAWHRPAQAVVETGRSKRRDFYLIQLIELPATLGVGKYNLKVTVRDNTTGAETEAVLPVHLVADSALASPR